MDAIEDGHENGVSVVTEDGDSTSPAIDPNALTVSIMKARLDLERAIQVAYLKNDPVAPLLRSIMASLEIQNQLHQGIARHLRDVSSHLDLQVSQSLALAESELAAKEAAVVSKLAPQLAAATDRSIRARLWTIKLQTIATIAGGTVILMLAVLAAGYTIGFTSGRANGLHLSSTIAASIARNGPDAAASWTQLMMNNDVRSAMAECEKTITRQGSRRACALPVWLDPPAPPITGSTP